MGEPLQHPYSVYYTLIQIMWHIVIVISELCDNPQINNYHDNKCRTVPNNNNAGFHHKLIGAALRFVVNCVIYYFNFL